MNAQPQQSYHYHVMRRAIDLIDAAGRPLSLSELAGEMQMSPAHFQRLFTAWVGVSPKRYQQYLALDQAKALLAARFTTLETAQELGLRGTPSVLVNGEQVDPSFGAISEAIEAALADAP